MVIMDRTNLEKYYASVTILFSLFSKGIIDADDYLKSEEFLAKKHCIKIGNLYRRNDLIKHQTRAIYVVPEEVN